MSAFVEVGSDRLQGWKEIAAHLCRDERTVKRWEKQRGLPVRRLPGGGRANVYCVLTELEAWQARQSIGVLASELDREWMAGDAAARVSVPEGFAEAVVRPASVRDRVGPGLLLTGSVLLFAAVLTVVLVRHGRGVPGGGPGAMLAGGQRPPAAVLERYLQGEFFLEKRTPEDLDKARLAFEDCIRKEPRYAAAYAGLASTFLLLREYSTMPEAEAYLRGQEAAERAIALDAKEAEAHAALGFIDFFYYWRPADAEREFETAVLLDPGSAEAHHWYGSMLLHQARFSKALEQLSIAQRLQPTSAAILATKMYALGLSGHRNEVTDTLQTLGLQTGDTASLHWTMASLSLIEPQNIPRYLEERRRFAEIRRDAKELDRLALADAAYRRAGVEEMWRELLRQEITRHGSSSEPTFEMARLEAALGHNERAVEDMLVLLRARDPSMVGVQVDTMLGPLRRSAEFERLSAAMQLERVAEERAGGEVQAMVRTLPKR